MISKKSFMRLLNFLLAIIIFFSSLGNVLVSAESNIVDDLKANLIPIESLELEKGNSDLQALKEILKDKEIIGLGSSTIGAKEFFSLKWRITRFLIEEMGYRKIAFDGNFEDIEMVNNYINKDGDIKDALWELKPFPITPEKLEGDEGYRLSSHTYVAPFTSEEYSEILTWIRDFNQGQDSDEKIVFYGIGIDNPKKSVDNLIDYIQKVDKDKGKIYKNRYRDILMVHSLNFKYPQSRPLGLLSGMLEDLKEDLELSGEKYKSISTMEDYDKAIRNIAVTDQWISYSLTNLNHGMDKAINLKEEYLADNVKWAIDQDSSTRNNNIIFWTINNHINKEMGNYTSLGEHLYNEFGGAYYALAMDFFQGQFRAYGINLWGSPISNYIAKFSIDKSGEDYFSHQIAESEIPVSILDFKSASKNENISVILNKEYLFHNASLMYPGKYVPERMLTYRTQQKLKAVPIKSYDGFLFVHKISASKGLHDERDTKIEDGDGAIVNYYKDMIVGQAGTILSVLLVLVLVILLIIKKWKKRKGNHGARYPGSGRWD